MRRPGLILCALLALLALAMALRGQLVPLPSVPNAAAAGTFDTRRAMARLQRILGDQRPHPVDTAAGDAVRGRLVAELRAIGLQPVVRDSVACNGHGENRAVSCARVRNVLATIGPDAGRHVLLVSHYDSTPTGPGAADDGIGVAAMLQAAALLKDRPLARPVTFLFDEGEEAGLLGARAFLEHDPLAAQVGEVVNLESRGVTGPAIMFETSRPNGAAIAHFAKAAPQPVANSLTTDFYRLIPNSTDVTVFAERPWTILNFAIIGNETRYHSPGDRLDALDPRSVRHMGVQAVAVAQELAGAAPAAPASRIYADVLGQGLVVMPLTVGLALLALLLVLFVWIAWRRRAGLGRAAAAVAVSLAGAAALSFAGQWLVSAFRHGIFWRAHPGFISFAVDLCALAACVWALAWLARRTSPDRLRAAFWLIFLLLGAATCAAAPGAAIFFLAPPVVMALGMLLEIRRAGAERIAALIAWLLLFLSWAPLLQLSQELLDFKAAWLFAPFAALLLLPPLIELKPLLGRSGRTASALVAAAAVIGWIAVALAPAYSPDRKQGFGIEYAWDKAAGKGQWLVVGDGAPLPDAFTGFRKGVEMPWSTRKRWAAAAPDLPVVPPSLETLATRPVATSRLLTLRLHANGAEQIVLRAEANAGLLAVRAGGSLRRFGKGQAKDPFFLRCHGRSCDGLVLDLLVAGSAPVDVTAAGIRSGLPAAAAPLLRARPANAAPQYSPDATIALDKIRL
jgi:hypothetical protein